VRAADSGDKRAKQRLAAIRAAVSGGKPMGVAAPRNGSSAKNLVNEKPAEKEKDDKECITM